MENVTVLVLNNVAFAECTCGKEIGLSKHTYGMKHFEGSCKCGIDYIYKDNKLVSLNHSK